MNPVKIYIFIFSNRFRLVKKDEVNKVLILQTIQIKVVDKYNEVVY
jgi:hypothetical protein